MGTIVASAMAAGSSTEVSDTLTRELRAKLGTDTPEVLFVFASTSQPLGEVLPAMQQHFPSSVVLGASTAGEFTELGDRKNATAVLALAGDYKVYAGIGTGLSGDPERAISQALEGQPSEVRGYPYRCAVLLLDPLAGNGEEATLLASAVLGGTVLLAGGAAGDYLAMRETLVGAGARVSSDAVVVAQIFSKKPVGVGISHGHRALSQPLKVTKAEGNTVVEVEGRPAWDVWREQTRELAKARGVDVDALTPDQIPGFLLQYEAGLRVGEALKIRAPLSTNPDGSIAFACGVPAGTVVRITESEPERQVESAREAARRARQRLGDAQPAGALVFDCICRNLILGTRFESAVRAMSAELSNKPVAGFETYGEIALDVGDMSGFHNTTTVVLAFPE